MKLTVSFALMYILMGVFACKSQKTPDSVDIANQSNAKKAVKDAARENVAAFLVKMTDGRLMDSREGQAAANTGTVPAIREYGLLMIKDQGALLKRMRELAIERDITLPNDISNEKKEGLANLEAKRGKDFDEEFIKMMIIDHERDIKAFKNALKLRDKEIRGFASLNLPIIESHLAKIKVIRDGE